MAEQEGICGYYKDCNMRRIGLRDCTNPAYKTCETYTTWEASLSLGIGAITAEGLEVVTKKESAGNSTNGK